MAWIQLCHGKTILTGAVFPNNNLSPAHGSWSGRWGPVSLLPRLLPPRLPGDPLHRVQRGPGHLPLLRQQVLLLAGHHPDEEHVRPPSQPDVEGRQLAEQGVQMPGVQEEKLVPKNLPHRISTLEFFDFWRISKEVNYLLQDTTARKRYGTKAVISELYQNYMLFRQVVIIPLVSKILFSP